LRLSIIAGLIVTVLAALAVACGGDDDKATNTPGAAATTAASGGDETSDATATNTPTGGGTEDLNEYFRDLAARFERSSDDTDAVTTAFNAELDAATTLDDQKQVIKDFLDAMIEVFDDSILTMNGFSVPEIAEDPHFTFRDDIVEAKAMSETLKDDLDAAGTTAEAQAVINDFDVQVGALVNHAQAACRDLQEIADAQNINEELDCKAA